MLSETYFNQTQLKLCYMLSQTYTLYEIYPHILIMDTSVELPAKQHFNVFICTVLRSIHPTKKMSGTSLLAEIWIYKFDLICEKVSII